MDTGRDDDMIGISDSVSQCNGIGDADSMSLSDDEGLGDGEISIIERRRRVLECFSDMMGQSMIHMKTYFAELDEFQSLSQSDQETLFNAAILEILILKCYFTFNGGRFIHPETKEEMVSRDILLLGTNDTSFVSNFIDIFSRMETMKFKQSDILLLMCISMFDTGRAEMAPLDDRQGIINRQQIFVQKLLHQLPPEHMAEAIALRTTLKELKSGFRGILMRTYTNRSVQLTSNVNQLIESLFK